MPRDNVVPAVRRLSPRQLSIRVALASSDGLQYTGYPEVPSLIVLFKLVVLVIAVVHIFNPRVAWYMSEGWKFRDAEPNPVYLGFLRVVGVVITLVVLFTPWS